MTYLQRRLQKWKIVPEQEKWVISLWKRYIDDVFTVVPDGFKLDSILYKTPEKDGIYPSRLLDKGKIIEEPLKLNAEIADEVNFLDVTVTTGNRAKNITFKNYDKREYLIVNGKKLSELRNFPDFETKLPDVTKYGVVASQMHRFNRRTSSQKEFIDTVVKMIEKMIKYGYRKGLLISKVISYKHWTPNLGSWKKVRRILLYKTSRIPT